MQNNPPPAIKTLVESKDSSNVWKTSKWMDEIIIGTLPYVASKG